MPRVTTGGACWGVHTSSMRPKRSCSALCGPSPAALARAMHAARRRREKAGEGVSRREKAGEDLSEGNARCPCATDTRATYEVKCIAQRLAGALLDLSVAIARGAGRRC